VVVLVGVVGCGGVVWGVVMKGRGLQGKEVMDGVIVVKEGFGVCG